MSSSRRKNEFQFLFVYFLLFFFCLCTCAVPQNLRLWNNTLSFHYWQRPGVIRLTKVYIFNVTNPDGFLNGEKPKLVEVGPFVYRLVFLLFEIIASTNYLLQRVRERKKMRETSGRSVSISIDRMRCVIRCGAF